MLIHPSMNATNSRILAGLGGAAGTVLDVGALILLVEVVRAPVPAASFLASMAGAGLCFIANKYVAFRDHSAITFRQVATFAMVALATAIFMALAMQIVAVQLHVPYLLSKLLCAATIFVAWTYPAQRRFVFKQPALAAAL